MCVAHLPIRLGSRELLPRRCHRFQASEACLVLVRRPRTTLHSSSRGRTRVQSAQLTLLDPRRRDSRHVDAWLPRTAARISDLGTSSIPPWRHLHSSPSTRHTRLKVFVLLSHRSGARCTAPPPPWPPSRLLATRPRQLALPRLPTPPTSTSPTQITASSPRSRPPSSRPAPATAVAPAAARAPTPRRRTTRVANASAPRQRTRSRAASRARGLEKDMAMLETR